MRASPSKEKEVEEVDVVGCGAGDDAGGKCSPAWAQQTSGAATANPSVDAAHAGNVCVQQVQNVNTGNVSQEQAAAAINEQISLVGVAVAVAEGEDARAVADARVRDVDVNQTQNVEQNITQSQQGISQTNNAFQLCNQTLNR